MEDLVVLWAVYALAGLGFALGSASVGHLCFVPAASFAITPLVFDAVGRPLAGGVLAATTAALTLEAYRALSSRFASQGLAPERRMMASLALLLAAEALYVVVTGGQPIYLGPPGGSSQLKVACFVLLCTLLVTPSSARWVVFMRASERSPRRCLVHGMPRRYLHRALSLVAGAVSGAGALVLGWESRVTAAVGLQMALVGFGVFVAARVSRYGLTPRLTLAASGVMATSFQVGGRLTEHDWSSAGLLLSIPVWLSIVGTARHLRGRIALQRKEVAGT